MILTKIAGDCDEDDCPAVYRTSLGTIGVRGTLLTGADCSDGEAIVEIPVDLLLSAARATS